MTARTLALLGTLCSTLACNTTPSGAPAPSASEAGPAAPRDASAARVRVVIGRHHACAVSGGQLWCWGDNAADQLGVPFDDHPMRYQPGRVAGLDGVKDVAPGQDVTYVLTTAGVVRVFGDEPDFMPKREEGVTGARVVPGVTGVAHLAAAFDHACAALQSGEVVCWGRGSDAQLDGEKAPDFKEQPPRKVAGIADAIQVAAGERHSCALHRGGAVSCWGSNRNGALGDGTEQERTGVVKVTGVDDAVSIRSYGEAGHTCVARRSGAVTCWGASGSGQLGAIEDVAKNGPYSPKPIADAIDVAVGQYHSCALRASGKVVCWGNGDDGERGIGFVEDPFSKQRGVPTADAEGVSDAVSIAAGIGVTCAGRASGELACWGNNRHGLLAQGHSDKVLHAVNVEGADDSTSVLVTKGAACAVAKDGSVRCWGAGEANLRTAHEGPKRTLYTKAEPIAGMTGVSRLLAVGHYICGLRDNAAPLCVWPGLFAYPTELRAPDVPWMSGAVKGLEQMVASSNSGLKFSYVALASGSVVTAQLDEEDWTDAEKWKRVSKTTPLAGAQNVAAVANGPYATCLLFKSGEVGCDAPPQGHGPLDPVSSVSVLKYKSIKDATKIDVRSKPGCLMRKSGEILCWPHVLTVAEEPTTLKPLEIGEPATDFAIAGSFGDTVCAVGRSGKVYCSSSSRNDLDGLTCTGRPRQPEPTACVGIDDATQISAHDHNVCVVRKSGRVACWGKNDKGVGGSPLPARVGTPVSAKLP